MSIELIKAVGKQLLITLTTQMTLQVQPTHNIQENNMIYGNKRDYPKIDIYVSINGQWQHAQSTTYGKTLKEALDDAIATAYKQFIGE